MIFSAIWDKSAQVNFSRANQICFFFKKLKKKNMQTFDYVLPLAVFMVH